MIEICEDYISGLNKKQICKKYNINIQYLNKILNENNIKSRGNKNSKYKINECFFENVDTKEKAYILGFLYADACLIKQPGASLSVRWT